MSILSTLTSVNPIASAVEGAASAVLGPLFGRLIDLIPDPVEKEKQAQELQKQLMAFDQQIAAGQLAIDQAEAQNSNVFVAGWRPFIGWICGATLVWQCILAPLIIYIAAMFNYAFEPPTLDTSWINAILIPMLGLGGLRTVEKVMGARKTGG